MTDPVRYGRRRALRHLKKRFEYQRELPIKTPLLQRRELWRQGYRNVSYTLYDDLRHNNSAYLPDTARLEAFFINGSLTRDILNDKLLFTKLAGEVLKAPTIVALIERGGYLWQAKGPR